MPRIIVPIGLAASLAASLALGACRGPHPHAHARAGHGWSSGAPMSVPATLACPQTVGALTRTAQAADGQSCDYRGRDGEQVELRRLALNGRTPQAALGPVEAALAPLIPARSGPSPVSVDADDADADDHAKVDLPGIHVNAHGDKADVKVFGVSVNADGDDADVHVGHGASRAVVKAGPDGAEIRADDVTDANASLVLILANDHAGPSGLHAAGYMARGPVKGPLAVVTFKSAARHNDWRGDRDLNGLLELNVKQ